MTSYFRLHRASRSIPLGRALSSRPLVPRGTQNLNSSTLRSVLAPRIRYASTSSSPPPGHDALGRRLWSLTTVGIYVGIGSLVYWLYTQWMDFGSAWPKDVLPNLRQALLARDQGDWATSEIYFRSVLEILKAKSPEELEGDVLLKLSGVSIALADVLEQSSQPQKAYDVYRDAFQPFQQGVSSNTLSGPELQRGISIAHKLGILAEELGYLEDEEKWLTWAAEVIIRNSSTRNTSKERKDSSNLSEPEMVLPEWASVTDVAAPLDALAMLYVRQGKLEYALPLYLHAASILIPPPPQKEGSPEDRCRGAVMMLKISDLLIQGSAKPETAHQAEAWAQKSLSVLESTRSQSWSKISICEEAVIAAYHGVAGFREAANDKPAARKLYSAALKQAQALNLEEETQIIEKCIDDLDNSGPSQSAQK
ncbi:hypothetical protein HGRIS_011745 [Hohenbuehelia grisea]|uniref:Uncharacterized protein n=1 Tax=Hohenbuehelia grisea TaxID=104357 RepID=A0ABR3JYB0_9AGAR